MKLLRVLQEREFERLGGTAAHQGQRAPHRRHQQGPRGGGAARARFREDLYYRLNVYSIYLPPLRERRPDIPLLADHFIEKHAAALGKDVRAHRHLRHRHAHELPLAGQRARAGELHRARGARVRGGVIHAHHLPPTLQTAEVSGTLPRRSLTEAVATYEKDLILDALKSARGNKAKAARLLDTTERILATTVRKHGIDPKRFRG